MTEYEIRKQEAVEAIWTLRQKRIAKENHDTKTVKEMPSYEGDPTMEYRNEKKARYDRWSYNHR